MANVQEYLNQIQQAVYGEEVRGSIVNAITAMNNESSYAKNEVSNAISAINIVEDKTNSLEKKNEEIERKVEVESIRGLQTCDMMRGIKINIDTEKHIIQIEKIGSGITLLFTSRSFYNPYALNPNCFTTIDYSEFIPSSSGALLGLVYDPEKKIFAIRNLDSKKFYTNDVVLFTVFFNSHYLVSDEAIRVYCGGVYLDGVECLWDGVDEVADNVNSLNGALGLFASKRINNERVTTSQNGLAVNIPLESNKTYDVYLSDISDNVTKIKLYIYKKSGEHEELTSIAPSDTKFQYTTPADMDYIRFYLSVLTHTTSVFVSANINIYEQGQTGSINGRLCTAEDKTKKVDQENLFNWYTCKIFRRVVCCGDSYTSGHIRLSSETAADPTNENFAWPHFMSTLTGNEWINCGCSGCNVLTWQNDERGLPAAKSKGKAQAYVIGLMINDSSESSRAVPLGEIGDIGIEEPTTYYGGMSKIIRELNKISENAKIFVNTCPKTGDNFTKYNKAVREIVNAYKGTYPVHCIDLAAVKELYTNSSLAGDMVMGHYTAIGYEQFAEIYAHVLSDYINAHLSEFQDVYRIGYEEPIDVETVKQDINNVENQLSESISKISDDVKNLTSGKKVYDLSKQLWTDGAINGSSGVENRTQYCKRTGRVDIDSEKVVVTDENENSETTLSVFFYNKSNNTINSYINILRSRFPFEFSIKPDCYCRFVYNGSATSATPDVNGLKLTDNDRKIDYIPPKVMDDFSFADTNSLFEFKNVKNLKILEINNPDNNRILVIKGKNLFDPTKKLDNTSLKWNGGVAQEEEYCVTSDFIPVFHGRAYAMNYKAQICGYDANQKFVESIGGDIASNRFKVTNSTICFVRLGFRSVYNQDLNLTLATDIQVEVGENESAFEEFKGTTLLRAINEPMDIGCDATIISSNLITIKYIAEYYAVDKSVGENTKPHFIKRKPMVTFIDDDGNIAAYHAYKDLMQEYKVPFCFAIVVWRSETQVPKIMTFRQMRDLVDNYGCEMLSHGYKSEDFTAMTFEQQEEDLTKSHDTLVANGFVCRGLVYPMGHNSSDTRYIANRIYDFGIKTEDKTQTIRINDNCVPSFYINRCNLGSYFDQSVGDYANIDTSSLDYYKMLVDECEETNGWLVFELHAWNASFDETQKQYLRQTIEYIKSKGIDIVTASEGYDAFKNIVECGDFLGHWNVDGCAINGLGQKEGF